MQDLPDNIGSIHRENTVVQILYFIDFENYVRKRNKSEAFCKKTAQWEWFYLYGLSMSEPPHVRSEDLSRLSLAAQTAHPRAPSHPDRRDPAGVVVQGFQGNYLVFCKLLILFQGALAQKEEPWTYRSSGNADISQIHGCKPIRFIVASYLVCKAV